MKVVIRFLRIFIILSFAVPVLGSGVTPVRAFSPAFLRVPDDAPTLSEAIQDIGDGGIIELRAGTYSAAGGSFRINDMGKGFTIRGEAGGTAVLSGGGQNEVLRFMNSDLSRGGLVIFENLVIEDGYSNTAGVAGGFSLHRAQAVFNDVVFRRNSAGSSGAGGGIVVTLGSEVTFKNCLWESNTAVLNGGGLLIAEGSTVIVEDSSFTSNRTNLPGHARLAAGGAIHAGNSRVSILRTHFRGNRAGYTGGAVYLIGSWREPFNQLSASLYVNDSSFIDNQAKRDSSVILDLPTEGGAIDVEGQSYAYINNSVFTTNQSEWGGAVSVYRARVGISKSQFLGNRAVGSDSLGGYGGVITVSSNDTSADGSVNRPNALLVVRDSLFQGRYDEVMTVAQGGGGIYAVGDYNRMYGANGVIQMGDAADNRTRVVLESVIFNDLDVVTTKSDAYGGALLFDLNQVTLQDVMILNASSSGDSSGGGGMGLIDQSSASLVRTTFANNTAGDYGAGLFVQGSEIFVDHCLFIGNELSPGEDEPDYLSFGAALFTSPDTARLLPARGSINTSTFSDNTGLAIFEQDQNGLANDIRYNENTFYASTYGDSIYQNTFSDILNVPELNELVINRSATYVTEKSQVDNYWLNRPPHVGSLLAVPSYHIPRLGLDSSIMGYAYSGAPAELDEAGLSEPAGYISDVSSGVHTLVVGDEIFTAEIVLLDQALFLPVIR